MRRVLLPLLLAVPVSVLLPSAPGTQEPPGHLEPVLAELKGAGVAVLVPPERPPGTTATLAEAAGHFYRVLFTNDPEGRLAHAEQVNVFVAGSDDPFQPPIDAHPVEVRDAQGAFFCGAAACFLDWREADTTFSVGEFGAPDDAVGFAESLVSLEELAEGASPPPPTPTEDGLPLVLMVLVTAAAVALLTGTLLVWRGKRS